MPRRSRAFTITWWQGDHTWVFIYHTLDNVVCDYIIYQTELSPETGNQHIQGYIYFANGKTLERVRALFPGASIEVAIRSAKINKEYCSKIASRKPGGIAKERGTMPDQGARTDIVDARLDIEAGMNDFDMFVKHNLIWARYSQVLIRHRAAMVQPRNFWTKTLVLWGRTGLGKSTRAHWHAQQNGGRIGQMMLPRNADTMVWADGCIAADTIIIEDIGLPGNFAYSTLKNMLDWAPCRMPVKGMSMQWAPHHVIITSNFNPREWYPTDGGDWDALNPEGGPDNPLKRRLTTRGSEIIHMERRWNVPPTPRVTEPLLLTDREDPPAPPIIGYGGASDVSLD